MERILMTSYTDEEPNPFADILAELDTIKPVEQDSAGWYFFDEDGHRVGPYPSEAQAYDSFDAYCEEMA